MDMVSRNSSYLGMANPCTGTGTVATNKHCLWSSWAFKSTAQTLLLDAQRDVPQGISILAVICAVLASSEDVRNSLAHTLLLQHMPFSKDGITVSSLSLIKMFTWSLHSTQEQPRSHLGTSAHQFCYLWSTCIFFFVSVFQWGVSFFPLNCSFALAFQKFHQFLLPSEIIISFSGGNC